MQGAGDAQSGMQFAQCQIGLLLEQRPQLAAMGGLILVIFGYFFAVLALVFLIAALFDNHNAWIGVLAGAALFHFIIAGLLLLIARMRLGAPLFPLTLEELKKDQEWLKTNAKPN